MVFNPAMGRVEASELFKQYQRVEKLRRELELVKLANRAREVILVIHDFCVGKCHIHDVNLAGDLAADVLAVVELRKKALHDRIKSLQAPAQQDPPVVVPLPPATAMPEPAEPPGAVAGDLGASVPRRGRSYLLDKAVAILAEESGGVQPTVADVDRFLRELLLLH